MKKITAVVALLVLVCSMCLMVFSGCELFITNDRSGVQYIDVVEKFDGIYFPINDYRRRGQVLVYQKESNELSWKNANIANDTTDIVLDMDTTVHGHVRTAEGYEALETQVLDFFIEGVENPIHHALAVKHGDTVYGFCNIYSSQGSFTDGLDCKGIDRGILFTYDSETEELTIIDELEKCIVIAFDGTGVIWFENRMYYGKEMGGSTVEICEDVAYATKLSNGGRSWYYFGGGYCIIYFSLEQNSYFRKQDKEKNYDMYVLVTMSGEKITEYKQVRN